MSTEPTSGPWRIWISSHDGSINVVNHQNEFVCQVGNGMTEEGRDRMLADARLIASVNGVEKARMWSLDDNDVIKDMIGLALDRVDHAMKTSDDGLQGELLGDATEALKHAFELMSVK